MSLRVAYIRGSEAERFWPKVDVEPACWVWMAAKNEHGYGIFRTADARNVRAHRWAYEHLVGPLPDGIVLDHVCRRRACVNPDHLEPVTHAENVRRGPPGHRNWRSKKTHCAQGHPRTPENTYLWRGRAQCAICRQARSRGRSR